MIVIPGYLFSPPLVPFALSLLYFVLVAKMDPLAGFEILMAAVVVLVS